MPFGLPSTNKVCLYATETAGDAGALGRLKDFFESRGGFSVDYDMNVSIEKLASLPHDISVFVFTTHGVHGAGGKFEALQTGSRSLNDVRNPVIRDLLTGDSHNSLVGRDGPGYLILYHEFIRRNWRFPKNSFVFINGCQSFNESNQNGSLWQILTTDCNAGVFGGWKAASSGGGDTEITYLFNYLLGANTPHQVQVRPLQRPFDWMSIFDLMKATGRDRAPILNPGGSTTFTQMDIVPGRDSDLCCLVPSIEYVDIDETNKTVNLTGFFGSGTPGIRVFVRDKPDGKIDPRKDIELAAKPPENGRDIRCSGLPDSGRGSSGYIVAAADYGDGHLVMSNAVPITAWHAQMTYTIQAEGGLIGRITADLFLRGDIHKHREKPEGPLLPRECRFELVRDESKPARFVSSGTLTNPVTRHKYRWSGEGTILPGARGGTEGKFTVTGVFRDPEAVTIPQLRMALVTGDNQVVYEERDDKNKVVKEKANSPISLAILMLALRLPWKYGDILDGHITWPETDGKYETSYDIPCPASLKGDFAYAPLSSKAVISAELQWGTLTASYCPDDNTPG